MPASTSPPRPTASSPSSIGLPLHNTGPINMQIQEVRDKLCSIQADILKNPFEENMHKHEEVLEADLCILLQREENIAHQRSRVQWLELGDQNNAYFHKKIASNWNNSKMDTLLTS
ncbi:hypothetical protein POM88_037111 [Heracleum sosnowskyi]|uniref:Uncharacterized protein n=1 Tax=Heracleum sosnowskyi TaxID=360622 RepID=A0AAD8HPL6_9APIA|nr:hypothetical protein POM88_037111 [Heracleum sosnowskyi]